MDFQVLSFINQLGHGTRVDIISQYISWNRSMIIIRVLVISLALMFKKKYRKFVLFSFVLAGTLFFGVSEIGFKTLLVQETGIRIRPYIAHVNVIQPIGKRYTDSSFPSSHMVITVAMLTVLILIFPALWPYAVLYALLMARTRMHNGMHYPSDILAWIFFWFFCGWIGVILSRKVFASK